MIPRQTEFETRTEEDSGTVTVTSYMAPRPASLRLDKATIRQHGTAYFDDAITKCQQAVFASLYGDLRTRLQLFRKAFNRRYDDQEMLGELTKILEMLELRQ